MVRTTCRVFNRVTVFILSVVLLYASAQAGESKITLRLPGKESQSILCIQQNGIATVSIVDLATALGFAWQWEESTRKLQLTLDSSVLVLCQNSTAFSVNGKVGQLPVGVVRLGAWLYLPAAAACELFTPFVAGGIAWNAETRCIEGTFTGAAGVISRAGTEITEKPVREQITNIVIDPGHGGHDPGAIGPSGIMEKDLVLKIGLELRDLIRKKTDLTVSMTRDKDVFIPLETRTRFANEKKADIFISIHANSIGGSREKKRETKGYKVYFLSQAKNEEDKLAAMQENAVVELEHAPKDMDALQNIIIAMVNNEYLVESQELSIIIDTIFKTSLGSIDRLHHGVGQAPFWVLNGAFMPSVLVEIGFISNADEEKLLAEATVQKRLAKGMFEAILVFKKRFEAEND